MLQYLDNQLVLLVVVFLLIGVVYSLNSNLTITE